MAHSSTSASSFNADSYLSEIVTGAHGDKYQKDLALVMFERATRKGYDFKLGYEMAIADKFDDVVFFNKSKNECILIQTKHADTSKDRPAPLKFDMLLPKDDTTREKGDFSLFKYLKSYMTVQVNIKERKNVIIFTNRDFLRDSLEQSIEVVDRQVDEILHFENAGHVGLKVKDQIMKELLDYVNRDFNSLKDSIVKLFKEETMDQTVKKFITPLASIFIRTNTSVRFAESPSSEAGQLLLESLGSVMDIRSAQLSLNKCKDLFMGKSRNNTLPLFITDDIAHQFFKELVLSVRQPDDLGSIITQDLRMWMRTWIRPDYLTRLEEPQLKMSAVTLEEFFYKHQSQETTVRASKKFFQLIDGEDFYSNIKKDLTKQIRNLSNYNGDTVCEYYISRQIKYLELYNNQTNRDKNSDKDGNYGSSRDKLKDAGLAIFPPITHVENTLLDADRCVEMRIRDDTFANELFGKFENQNILLLTAEPGMGKSTILQFIALAAQKTADICVYLFYLNTFNQKFEEMKESNSSDQLLSILKTALSETYFKNFRDIFKRKDSESKHLLLFDALDEVTPHNRTKVLDMFKYILTVPNVKILVSARKNVKTLVENKLTATAFSLEPFDKSDQTNFLRKFWEIPAQNESSFLKYVDHLFNDFHSGFNQALSEFTGLPLMLKMLAEVYTDHFNKYLHSEQNDIEKLMPKEMFSVINLYEQFVRKCFANKMKKKFGNFNLDMDSECDPLFKKFTLEHQLLAIKYMQIKKLRIILEKQKYSDVLNEFEKRIKNGTEKSPLIESVDNDIKFIHRSYAEFLAAKFLFRHVENFETVIFKVNSKTNFLKEYPMIRIFFFALIEDQFHTKYLKILKKNYKKNSNIVFWACEVHGEKTVKFLLRTKSGSTIINRVLYVAAKHNCYNICTYLFENYKVEVDCIFNNSTPLQVAAEKGHADIVKLLLDRCAYVFSNDAYGWTPLHDAAANGHLDVVKMLIEKSADINAKQKDDWTPLHLAAQNDHSEVAKLLIEKSAHVNAKDVDDYTPLHIAAQNGHSEVAKMLIEKSADVNAKQNNDYTPLHLAAQNGHCGVAKMLIEKSVHINAKQKDHCTPLHLAAKNGHSEVAKMLIERSADINAKAKDDWTPLHLAAENGHSEVAKMLIEQSADINAKQIDGWTPLHITVKKGHLEVAKMLIEKSADKNAKQKNGCTPLHLAARNGHTAVVKVLIDCSADTGASDNKKRTPRDHAVEKNHKEVVSILTAVMIKRSKPKPWWKSLF